MGQQKGWHPEDIKAALRKRGFSLTALAGELGITVGVVSATLRYDNHRSRRIEAAVALKLGLSPKTIWPQRYSAPARHRGAAAVA